MKRVADCFVEDEGRVLLVKADYRDFWQFPGGHAEEGETPYQTAVREVREEVGGGIQVTNLLVLNTETDERGQAETFCFLFAGTRKKQAPIILQTDELSEFAWVPIGEVSARLHPLVRPLLSYARRALVEGRVFYLEGGQVS